MRDGRLTDKLSIREQTPGIWCGVTSSVATAGPPFFSIGQPPDEPSGLSRLFRENHPYFNSDNVRRDKDSHLSFGTFFQPIREEEREHRKRIEAQKIKLADQARELERREPEERESMASAE